MIKALCISVLTKPDPKVITNAVAQTLACSMSDVDATKALVVTWTKDDGTALPSGITFVQGTVDNGGVQKSVLTISAEAAKLLPKGKDVTYKCSAKSSQFASSPKSPAVDVVGKVLDLSKCPSIINCIEYIIQTNSNFVASL